MTQSKIETVTLIADNCGQCFAGDYRVLMPSDYDPAQVTGDDLVQDSAVRIVDEYEWELYLISDDTERHGDCDPHSPRLLGVYDTREEAMAAGRAYRADHPHTWLQVSQDGGQGVDVA